MHKSRTNAYSYTEIFDTQQKKNIEENETDVFLNVHENWNEKLWFINPIKGFCVVNTFQWYLFCSTFCSTFHPKCDLKALKKWQNWERERKIQIHSYILQKEVHSNNNKQIPNKKCLELWKCHTDYEVISAYLKSHLEQYTKSFITLSIVWYYLIGDLCVQQHYRSHHPPQLYRHWLLSACWKATAQT